MNQSAWSFNITLLDVVKELLHDDDVNDDDLRVAAMLTVLTPLFLVGLCCIVMICRGVPCAPFGGACSYWRRMPPLPRGTEPDCGIGEHQDENCDVDSADEAPRVETRDYEDDVKDESKHAQCVFAALPVMCTATPELYPVVPRLGVLQTNTGRQLGPLHRRRIDSDLFLVGGRTSFAWTFALGHRAPASYQAALVCKSQYVGSVKLRASNSVAYDVAPLTRRTFDRRTDVAEIWKTRQPRS